MSVSWVPVVFLQHRHAVCDLGWSGYRVALAESRMRTQLQSLPSLLPEVRIVCLWQNTSMHLYTSACVREV